MKHRNLALLLAASLCLSLSACGEAEQGEAAAVETEVEAGAKAAAGEAVDVGAMAGTEVDAEAAVETKAGTEGKENTKAIARSIDGMALGSGLGLGEATASLDEHPDRAIRRSVTQIQQGVGTMLDGSSLPGSHYLYRNTLDDNGKQAYDLIRSGLLNAQAAISMTVPVSPDDIFNIYQMVIFDSPELFWVETTLDYSYNNYGNVTQITPYYNDLVYDIEVHKARLEGAVASALVNGQTVCAGYAHAFQYMMQKMGIPCAFVVGYAGEKHAWNVLELDGKYYAMDVTWDDPIGARAGDYYYNYFNVTDAQLAADHSRSDLSQVLPWAYGTTCSYQNSFNGNAYGTDFDAIDGSLPDEAVSGGDDSENPYFVSEDDGENPYFVSGGEEENPYIDFDNGSDGYACPGKRQ